jgi:hypothetical protein
MTNTGRPLRTLVESFELALQYLSSPWNIRNNDQVAWQKTVLRLAFAEPIHYCRNQGVRTPNIFFPFKVWGKFQLRNVKWRTREDSNLWPLPSEGSALSS